MSRAVLGMIEDKFEEYNLTKTYLKYKNKPNEFYEYAMDTLRTLPDVELMTLNEMVKMLSSSNCWCVHYHIGRVVHSVTCELFGLGRQLKGE